MQDFHQLNVWQKSHSLVLRLYKASKALPDTENFGLILNQRRAATAVPRFIAEGCAKDSDSEFAVDLKRARAALYELEYLVLLCRDLGFYSDALHDELAAEIIAVRKMLSGLLKRTTGTPDATIGSHAFSL